MKIRPHLKYFHYNGVIAICFGDPLPNGSTEGWVNSVGNNHLSKSNFERIYLTKQIKEINETKANN